MRKRIAIWVLTLLVMPILAFALYHFEPSADNLECLGSYAKAWKQLHVYNIVEGSTDNLLISGTSPTISSGFGTSPSIVKSNGTAAFTINVGTGGTATSGVIGLPSAANGWACFCTDITTNSTTVTQCKQTASSTTTATIGNFSDVAVAAAWTASDVVQVSCHAY